MEEKSGIYKHYKNKRFYEVLHTAKMQINQEWFDCIVYRDVINMEVYVREENSFDESFLAGKG